MSRKPIFLDRDGVINRDLSPYVLSADQMEIFPWTLEALRLLDQNGFDIYIISNQQGVAKGLLTQNDLDQMSEKIQNLIRPHGFQIKHFYYCTAHKSENSPNRKPGSGMVFQAQKDHDLNIENSFFIGDKESDMQCALGAGCRYLLVYTGVAQPGDVQHWDHQPEAAFPTLLEAVQYIVSKSS
jgi:D-glycero-D-manno-heptose 1,7-bisphosphate phosphatase